MDIIILNKRGLISLREVDGFKRLCSYSIIAVMACFVVNPDDPQQTSEKLTKSLPTKNIKQTFCFLPKGKNTCILWMHFWLSFWRDLSKQASKHVLKWLEMLSPTLSGGINIDVIYHPISGPRSGQQRWSTQCKHWPEGLEKHCLPLSALWDVPVTLPLTHLHLSCIHILCYTIRSIA